MYWQCCFCDGDDSGFGKCCDVFVRGCRGFYGVLDIDVVLNSVVDLAVVVVVIVAVVKVVMVMWWW